MLFMEYTAVYTCKKRRRILFYQSELYIYTEKWLFWLFEIKHWFVKLNIWRCNTTHLCKIWRSIIKPYLNVSNWKLGYKLNLSSFIKWEFYSETCIFRISTRLWLIYISSKFFLLTSLIILNFENINKRLNKLNGLLIINGLLFA